MPNEHKIGTEHVLNNPFATKNAGISLNKHDINLQSHIEMLYSS